MSDHLSSRQFDELLVGDAPDKAQRHLRECPFCQKELERLREPFANFRQSVRGWSDEQLPAPLRIDWHSTASRSWMSLSKLSLAAVAVALCLLFAVSFPSRQKSQPVGPSVSDAALLSQVDAEVSRSVPGPMEPLTEFLSNDSSKPAAATSTAHKEAP
jgi:anti-sigma factor RsiW